MHVARSLQPADTGSTSNRQPAPGRPSSRVYVAQQPGTGAQGAPHHESPPAL
jgi:hypothetical protein